MVSDMIVLRTWPLNTGTTDYLEAAMNDKRARHSPGWGAAAEVQITRNISRGVIHNAKHQFILRQSSWTHVLQATELEAKKLFTQGK